MCDERPEVIKEMKSLWTGIYIKDGDIYNQNKRILPNGSSRCPMCIDCNFVCKDCLVTETFAHRYMFRNMKKETQPCMVLIRRIKRSRRPQGLLHSYLDQIERHIKRKRTQVVEEGRLLTC